ncbi:methyltransferase domain-containing protein [Cyanobium sp. BA20m-14]|uniref:class I SAM-dependent methyltransferase n=1 Tax=Cyanobium sp. BA20m-14 TaxID=2823703 RepID=UPI0020CC058C|nr:class I SAM-dependent methyltransferase [Cyanobium sp. BA20m-14]MCP9912927.1 methyltransferase domain-containing protein [Cyanobium sp. BA20m-14]
MARRPRVDCPGGPGSLSALLRADLEAAMATLATSSAIRPDFNLDACRQEHLEALADRHAHRERYLAASLPNLPFADQSFDLVLSGHLLFSYAPCSAGGLMEKTRAGSGLAPQRTA